MDMNIRNFKFVKDYPMDYGTITEGNDLQLFRGLVSLNGGILDTNYQKRFIRLIENELKTPNFLKEIK
jgi:hypothetical protein